VEQEITKIMDIVDQNKKNITKQRQQQQNQQRALEIRQKVDFQKNTDVIKDYCSVDSLQVGNILDAQDDYGTWHLSIVIDATGHERKLHFLPFSNSNRDETFKNEDENRVGPAYS